MSADLCACVPPAGAGGAGLRGAVVRDATGALRHLQLGDGYPGAVVDFGSVAQAVLVTGEAVEAVDAARVHP